MENILALDPSTKSTGVALFQDGKLTKYKCLTATSSNLFARIQKIISQLDEILKTHKINHVYIEDVIPDDVRHNQQVYKALTYLQGFILNKLNEYNIQYTFFISSEWRKKCDIKTGRGVKRESLKSKDITFVKEKFNIEVNDDIADAICIGYAAVYENDRLEFE